MVDYWQSGNATTDGAAAGAAQPAVNGDATMDDEILVGCISHTSELILTGT